MKDFIVIEGNIGAGKTTLCQMLAEEFGFRLILEQFTDNPFLPHFYQHPERYGFPVELFFMTERHKQLQESLMQGELFTDAVIADYYFLKTLLFAKNNLADEEFRLFKRLFDVLNSPIRQPDLLVYLHRSIENLVENILQRGREFEYSIKSEYLEQIQKSYFDFFKTVKGMPVLVLDVEGSRFWENENEYHQLKEAIFRKYDAGVHYLKIRPIDQEIIKNET